MARSPLGIVWAILLFPNLACATKVVNFRTTGPAKVSLLDSGKLDAPTDPIGDTPLTVEVDKIRGKVVKITQPGALPIYWVMADVAGDTTDANLAFIPDPSTAATASNSTGDNHVDAKATTNRVVRLLLKAYQALAGKRFDTARELAAQAAIISPEVAGPHVIEGLALFQEGKSAEAKTALLKAQALDPEDKGIDELLEVVQR